MLYFAYGSNLNVERLLERCPTAQIISRGKLDGYKLVFKENNNDKIVASIEKGAKNKNINGVVFHIDERDVKKLDTVEGVPYVYIRKKVKILLESGIELLCDTYVLTEEFFVKTDNKIITKSRGYGKPNDDYLQHLVIGYKNFGFNIEKLKTAVKNSDKNNNIVGTNNTHKYYVFVYGTLMRGFHNHSYLQDMEYLGEGVILDKELFDLPYGYPAIKDGGNEVIGEIYKVDDKTLQDLDKLEGYNSVLDSGVYLRRTANIYNKNKRLLYKGVYYYLWNSRLPLNSIALPSGVKWGDNF